MSVLPSGLVLNQQYEIVEKVGGGGGGNVYEAFDQNLTRRIAVKHLILPSNDAVKHFKKEARLLANLEHACLPHVYNLFENDYGHFLVMAYIEGKDLDQYLCERPGPLNVQTVLSWADELLMLLDYLHNAPNQPIIHRDIKPANIKLSTTGQLKLIDFGLAKSDLSTQLNNVYLSVRGYTSTYAPLEQLVAQDGEPTDERSDIFAFGATLYHLLTGYVPINANQKPIDATNRNAMVIQSKPDPLLRPKLLNPEIPEYVDAAIIKAMAINKPDRFASASEFRQALNPTTVMKLSSSLSGMLSPRPKSQPTGSKSTQPSTSQSSQVANSTSPPVQSTSNAQISRQPSDHLPILIEPTSVAKPLKRFVPLLALLLISLIGGGWWWVNANPSVNPTTVPNQANQPPVLNAEPNQAPTSTVSSGSGSAAQPTTTLIQATATLFEPSATTTAEPTIAVVVQPTARPATARPVVQPTTRPVVQPTNPPPPPADRDGDGVADANDPCPDTNGPNNGCPAPPPPDRDGDGVADANDPCPDTNGPNNGCPAPVEVADRDGDTIPDDRDDCPNDPGDPSRRGCPKPVEQPQATNTPRPTVPFPTPAVPTKIVETPIPPPPPTPAP